MSASIRRRPKPRLGSLTSVVAVRTFTGRCLACSHLQALQRFLPEAFELVAVHHSSPPMRPQLRRSLLMENVECPAVWETGAGLDPVDGLLERRRVDDRHPGRVSCVILHARRTN